MLRRSRRFVAVGVALILSGGCQTAFEEGGKHGLPPAPPGATKFSEYQPDQPFVLKRPGVAERFMYTTSEGGHTVEVWDFLVSPTEVHADLRLQGAGLLDVRLGFGEATVGTRTIKLRPETLFTVDVSEARLLRVTALEGPLAIRATVTK